MNLKELKKFLQLCRDQGVDSIRYEGIEVHLGPMPYKAPRINKKALTEAVTTKSYAPGGITADTKILTDELTPEQMLFWSSTGEQPADPENIS